MESEDCILRLADRTDGCFSLEANFRVAASRRVSHHFSRMHMMADVVRAAGILIYRHKAGQIEYLLLQASYSPYHWSPPKVIQFEFNFRTLLEVVDLISHYWRKLALGHVDSNEDEWSAALRETFEEAGIMADNLDVHMDFMEILEYVVKKNNRYEGEKTVKYWLAKLKDDKEIKLSDEHKDGRWLSADEAIVLVQYKEMQDLIRKAQEYLVHKK
ncbi:unnamed protein product [Acanthocheilonema viteae]|uniref:Bis(5'-nucleosyl)-tetraphosphatase [asymmetrical] n=1 Tax=Acanthocheilonema viteae TaxID=6277 RepID=A0A498SAT6_ACAVI|nr:unnamed protein product [Acanthocheilonema viteae]